MTLASSGFLSFGGTTTDRSINLELAKSATATIGLNDSDARELANALSGNISVSDFYGKTYYIFGQEEFTTPGTYLWTCPADVTTVSVLCIGGGGGGDAGSDLLGVGGGGGGGALAYRNNIPVIPGQSYSITVGSGGIAQVVINGTTISDSSDGGATSAFSCIAGGGKKGTRATGDIVIGSTSAAGGTISGIYNVDMLVVWVELQIHLVLDSEYRVEVELQDILVLEVMAQGELGPRGHLVHPQDCPAQQVTGEVAAVEVLDTAETPYE